MTHYTRDRAEDFKKDKAKILQDGQTMEDSRKRGEGSKAQAEKKAMEDKHGIRIEEHKSGHKWYVKESIKVR